jgi:hypothetical protein
MAIKFNGHVTMATKKNSVATHMWQLKGFKLPPHIAIAIFDHLVAW